MAIRMYVIIHPRSLFKIFNLWFYPRARNASPCDPIMVLADHDRLKFWGSSSKPHYRSAVSLLLFLTGRCFVLSLKELFIEGGGTFLRHNTKMLKALPIKSIFSDSLRMEKISLPLRTNLFFPSHINRWVMGRFI